MTNKIPVNAAAREVTRLRNINSDIDIQINELRARQINNAEQIGAFLPNAEWTEEPGTEVIPVG